MTRSIDARSLLVALVITITGCGQSTGLSSEDYERAKTSLEAALDAWKKGEDAKKWYAKDAKIRFVDDDWIRHKKRLVDYKIVQIQANTDGYPEAIVELTTVQGKDKKETSVKGLYGINIKKPNQTSIGRDPMY
ncbi:MAG: hypothetical protein ACFCD0_18665 [Gemmataceae bacterium]